MRNSILRPVRIAVLCGLLPIFALTGSGHAADFPSRAVEIIINFPPGGIVDTSIRVMTEELSRNLGVPVVVINKGGSSGAVGAQYVMGTERDGHTILGSAVAAFNIVPLLNPGLSYKLSDFIPLARYAASPDVILVRKEAPYQSLEELVAYAKNNPGKLTCGNAGIGTASDFMLEMLKLETGMRFVSLPYKGGGELNAAVLGGHVDFVTNGIAAAQSLVKSGQLRALAINSYERSANLPDVPSLKELGYSKSVIRIGVGYFLPKGTPKPNVDKLASGFQKAIRSPAVKKSLETMGILVDYEDGPAFAASLANEYKLIEEVVKKAKLNK